LNAEKGVCYSRPVVRLLRPKGINEGMADVNLERREIISIEGTLLMLDGKTPHIRALFRRYVKDR
jgi:hypothetical protein